MASRLTLLTAVLALALSACGGPGGSGYGCNGRTCTATFDGTGTQDLSSELGDGAKIEVRDITGNTVNVAAQGTDHNLKTGSTENFGSLRITLESADGDSATLKVVKAE